MTKPFSPREVVARVKAILRPHEIYKQEEQLQKRQTKIASQIAELKIFTGVLWGLFPPTEESLELKHQKNLKLLVYLCENKSRVLTRWSIIKCW